MYNIIMKRMNTAIIGGGASGLFLGASLPQENGRTVLFERNDRLGKKLSATGNGQGNVTNQAPLCDGYFSSAPLSREILSILRRFDQASFIEFLQELGLLLTTDERGRVYPSSRQASAITDGLRYCLASRGVDLQLQTQIVDVDRVDGGFVLRAKTATGEEKYFAQNIVFSTGGKASKNFGTDGNGYALAKKFGHTVTALYPSLVQWKTDMTYTKTLKGIRVQDGKLTVFAPKGKEYVFQGDLIFTDYGLSGDAVFRASAFVADCITEGQVFVHVDFLPNYTEEEIARRLLEKRKKFPDLAIGELLGGMVNNQIGRAIFKRAEGDAMKAAALCKAFSLPITGSLGFDYAQVTKGGIPLSEVDEYLQSRLQPNVYFTGEILDIDGRCGGYNLQWAYSSARIVAEAIAKKGKR